MVLSAACLILSVTSNLFVAHAMLYSMCVWFQVPLGVSWRAATFVCRPQSSRKWSHRQKYIRPPMSPPPVPSHNLLKLYVLFSFNSWFLLRSFTSECVPPYTQTNIWGLRRADSKYIVLRLCVMFALDSFGGAFVMQTWIAFWYKYCIWVFFITVVLYLGQFLYSTE
jgi:hypothetical protein